jgi:hypothetical protein
MTRNFGRLLGMGLLLTVLLGARAEVYTSLPAGTGLQVRITENLDSETAKVGDQFHGTLATPVVVNGRTRFSKGAEVTGEVINVERSGRLSTPGELRLALRTIRSGGRTYAVAAQPFVIKGESHTKSNLTKIGGGAAAGAILGGIFGGGKGAAIGAGAGAAAGTGVAAATGKKPAQVESEAVLTWVTTAPPLATAIPNGGNPTSNTSHKSESGHPSHDYSDHSGEYQQRDSSYPPTEFSEHERRVISDCFVDNHSSLPPGLAKRQSLPPGLEKQLERNGTLPPGLQKRVQPMPSVCTASLPKLPQDWVRVVLSGRIILLNPQQRIVDMFWLEGE